MQHSFFQASTNCHGLNIFKNNMKIEIIAKVLYFLLKKVSIPEL